MMKALMEVSRFLDENSLKKIVPLLEELGELEKPINADVHRALRCVLQRVASYEGNPESKKIVSTILTMLDGEVLRNECALLLSLNRPVVTRICAEILRSQDLKLTERECEITKDVLTKEVESFDDVVAVPAWLDRIAALLAVLRISGKTTRKLVQKSLKNVLTLRLTKIPATFLYELSIVDIGHPLVVNYCAEAPSSSTIIFPAVYSRLFYFEMAVDSLTRFIERWFSDDEAKNAELARIAISAATTIASWIDSGIKLGNQHISAVAECWTQLRRAADPVGYPGINVLPLALSRFSAGFEPTSRGLFLKRLLHLVSIKESVDCSYEPQLVAVVVDELKNNLLKDVAVPNELGDVWAVLQTIKYESVYNASAFYASVFVLAHFVVKNKLVSVPMAASIKHILESFHAQIIDFQKVQSFAVKKNETELEVKRPIDIMRKNVEESVDNLGMETFNLVIYEYQWAIEAIDEFSKR